MMFRSSLLALAALAALTGPEQDPMKAPDRSWIRLTGDVASTRTDAFTLDYGDGLITVEMDDWDWYDESRGIGVGERVAVYGRIDDGLYELRTIEADSVYVYDRNTYYYASDVDEEGDALAYPLFAFGHTVAVPDGTWMSVSGEVVAIDGREFTIDNGFRRIVIDTDQMAYDPLDDEGFQKVEKGHEVAVTGRLDVGFFEKDEIKAQSIVTLSRDQKKKAHGEKKGEKKKEKKERMKNGS